MQDKKDKMILKKANINDCKEIEKIVKESIISSTYRMKKAYIKYLLDINSIKNIKSSIKDSKVYVIKDKKKIIATITLINGLIKRFYVKNGYAKNGIGSFLLKKIENKQKKLKPNIITLYCNSRALKFYLKKDYSIKSIINDKKLNETRYYLEKKL